MSFHETDLHTMIVRAYDQRKIAIGKVMRVTLQAVANRTLAVCDHKASALTLSQSDCDYLDRLAAEAEAQTEFRWWTKPPWSHLQRMFVNEERFWFWLNQAGASPTTAANAPVAKQMGKQRRRRRPQRPAPTTSNEHPERHSVSHRSKWQRTLAEKALKALYPMGLPDRTGKTDEQLCGEVKDWLADDKNWSAGETKRTVSRDSILRAANRRNK
jgi:hypothetical protein